MTLTPNVPQQRHLNLIGKSQPAVFSATALFIVMLAVASFLPGAGRHAVYASTMSTMSTQPAELGACQGCHGPDLAGRTGFSPSLHASGILKNYTKKKFETVMATGKTSSGGMVQKPMPVFKWKASQADAAYAYLKKLK